MSIESIMQTRMKQHQDKVLRAFANSIPPMLKQSGDLSAVLALNWNGNIKTTAKSKVKKFVTQPLPFLVLSGGVGTGKSTMAVWVAMQLLHSGLCQSALFIRSGELLTSFSRGSTTLGKDVYIEMTKPEVLIIDDIGGTVEMTPTRVSGLRTLIDARWSAGKITIITTNLDPVIPQGEWGVPLKELFGSASWDRMSSAGLVVEFSGESMRRKPKDIPGDQSSSGVKKAPTRRAKNDVVDPHDDKVRPARSTAARSNSRAVDRAGDTTAPAQDELATDQAKDVKTVKKSVKKKPVSAARSSSRPAADKATKSAVKKSTRSVAKSTNDTLGDNDADTPAAKPVKKKVAKASTSTLSATVRAKTTVKAAATKAKVTPTATPRLESSPLPKARVTSVVHDDTADLIDTDQSALSSGSRTKTTPRKRRTIDDV